MGIERFGRYRVVGPLGSGAMGDVYAAVDEVLGRDVAVKALRAGGGGLGAHLMDARFRHEARAIAALVHPSIVQVFDIDLEADPPYLVLERVAGPSLREQLAGGALAPPELRLLGIQIARALAAAHAAGVIHRDVKPANVLVAGPGAWKLADFGVAHVPDSSLTMSGQFVGTPAYASPEALVRGVSGPAGDVYGLGATLYQAAAGRWPRLDGGTTGLLAPVPPIRALVPGLPPALADAIDRAVAPDPGDRPTAAALADALTAATDAVAPTPAPVRRRWDRGAATLAAIVVVIAGVGALGRSGGSGAAAVAPLATPPASPGGPAPADDPAAGPAAEPGPPDPKLAKDWAKIQEEIEKGHYEGARHKLAEFEDRYGVSPESSALAAELQAAGPDVHGPGPGPGHGKHKGHKDD